MTNEIKITRLEEDLLRKAHEGMDEPNQGWQNEMGIPETKETTGVLGSLTKKGLIRSSSPYGDGTWLSLTDEGIKLAEKLFDTKDDEAEATGKAIASQTEPDTAAETRRLLEPVADPRAEKAQDLVHITEQRIDRAKQFAQEEIDNVQKCVDSIRSFNDFRFAQNHVNKLRSMLMDWERELYAQSAAQEILDAK